MKNREQFIINQLKDNQLLLLGFGKEGKSTYTFIRKHLPDKILTIADGNPNLDISLLENDLNVKLITGKNYLEAISEYDLILKSPGISLKNHFHWIDKDKISSQTDLFLQAYSSHCIGITGTKGKSTTATFMHHLLSGLNYSALIAGNIGTPLFDVIPEIQNQTVIVLELSSHQLEFIKKAPHIAILLNLFEEHLDHYLSFNDYQMAKFNIASKQNKDDIFIYNAEDNLIEKWLHLLPILSKKYAFATKNIENASCFFDENKIIAKNRKEKSIIFKIKETFPLKGNHNIGNICAALLAVLQLNKKDVSDLEKAAYSFKSLPHRMEYVGIVDKIIFYNDSISTIPQTTIAAVNTLKNVNTLILGGMDRGVDYTFLESVFKNPKIENFIFTGKAGQRMMEICEKIISQKKKNLFFATDYKEIVFLAKKITKKDTICLLSPAAASYDMFENFEERGNCFKKLVLSGS